MEYETGEASLEALLFDVMNELCGKRGKFEIEMGGNEGAALRLWREGVIS